MSVSRNCIIRIGDAWEEMESLYAKLGELLECLDRQKRDAYERHSIDNLYKYAGCSKGFLRNHLESLFKPGMSWENYGEWHVDHIVPLSWFSVKEDPSLKFVASHWTNLQPLWAKENMSKHNRYIG